MKQTKYVLVKDGSPIKFGDIIRLRKESTTSYGYYIHERELIFTEERVPELIEEGVIKEAEEKEITISDIRRAIGKAMGFTFADAAMYLNRLSVSYPAAAISVYLKTASDLINRPLEDRCFFFDLNDGTIKSVPVTGISDIAKNNCGIFSTKEDAIHAISLIQALIERVYGE